MMTIMRTKMMEMNGKEKEKEKDEKRVVRSREENSAMRVGVMMMTTMKMKKINCVFPL